MPGIVGAVQVISVGTAAVFHIGDVFQIHPVSTSKVFTGAGSFNTGETIQITNNYSSTNTYDYDGIDQGIMFTF